jgi:hypothetical protein
MLTPDLQQRLQREAERLHASVDLVAIQLLEKHLPGLDRQAAAVAMLQQWQAEDTAMSANDAVANVAILRSIDEDRLSDRKLFAQVLNQHAT